VHLIKFIAPVYAQPALGGLETELLHGEQIEVLEEASAWTRVRNLADGYAGYIPAGTYETGPKPTHLVTTLGSFLYTEASLKSPALERLSFLSRVAVLDEAGDYSQTPHGWLHRATLAPLGSIATNPLEVARRFLGIPYKWGGRTTLGMDCSALVQLAFAACGKALPRNSGDQAKALAEKSSPAEAGDIVIVPGHIGIATSPTTMIHASGHAMCVVEEPIKKMARERGFQMSEVRFLTFDSMA
jgi:cell wall-associated NlpC family hydrolase